MRDRLIDPFGIFISQYTLCPEDDTDDTGCECANCVTRRDAQRKGMMMTDEERVVEAALERICRGVEASQRMEYAAELLAESEAKIETMNDVIDKQAVFRERFRKLVDQLAMVCDSAELHIKEQEQTISESDARVAELEKVARSARLHAAMCDAAGSLRHALGELTSARKAAQ